MFRRQREPDPVWVDTVDTVVGRWHHWTDHDRHVVVDHARIFDGSRFWEGLDGLEVTPVMRGVVSAHAGVMTAGTGIDALRDVTAILFARTSAISTAKHRIGGSIVSESEACVLGEAMLHGPVRLAWDRVTLEWRSDASTSVVLHELAHKVDMSNGGVDGVPPIFERRTAQSFEQTLHGVLTALRNGDDMKPLRRYAGTNAAELFAVASEAFFLEPEALRARIPDLYGQLAGVYRQQPMRRIPG